MNRLFKIVDGIVSAHEYTEDYLSSIENVQAYAETCGENISDEQARKIIEVTKKWLDKRKPGRPPLKEGDKKKMYATRLPIKLIEWLQTQDNASKVIEQSIIKANDLKI